MVSKVIWLRINNKQQTYVLLFRLCPWLFHCFRLISCWRQTQLFPISHRQSLKRLVYSTTRINLFPRKQSKSILVIIQADLPHSGWVGDSRIRRHFWTQYTFKKKKFYFVTKREEKPFWAVETCYFWLGARFQFSHSFLGKKAMEFTFSLALKPR